MRNISFGIAVPHLFSPLSPTLRAEPNFISNALHFKIHETLQINQSNFIISINTFV